MAERKSRYKNRWLLKEWTQIVESFGSASEIPKGKARGKIKNIHGLNISTGIIEAKIQESGSKDLRVAVEVVPLTPSQWDEIVEILVANAIFVIRFLEGEVPEEIVEILKEKGIDLMPRRPEDFKITCSCNSQDKLCKHAEALFYAFRDKLEVDPLLLFKLRGMDRDELDKALREKRSLIAKANSGDLENIYQNVDDNDNAGLYEQSNWNIIDNYWIGGMKKDKLNIRIDALETEEIIFKRLGEPEFFGGKRDMVRQLKRDYQRILSKALTAGYS